MAAGEAGLLLCDAEGRGKGGESAKQEIAFHCEACQRRAGSSVSGDQRGTSLSLKEKKSESFGEAAAYIVRWPHPFWQALAGFTAIGLCSTAAEPLVHL